MIAASAAADHFRRAVSGVRLLPAAFRFEGGDYRSEPNVDDMQDLALEP